MKNVKQKLSAAEKRARAAQYARTYYLRKKAKREAKKGTKKDIITVPFVKTTTEWTTEPKPSKEFKAFLAQQDKEIAECAKASCFEELLAPESVKPLIRSVMAFPVTGAQKLQLIEILLG